MSEKKDTSGYKYEPVADTSSGSYDGSPLRVPSQIPVHPSHSQGVYDGSDKKRKDPMTEAEERAGNLFDYINWRGDVPMSVDPFNEVDNLLLSALIYAPFGGLVPDSGSITLYALNIAFWNKYTVSDFQSINPALVNAPFLLKKISSCRRYENVRACSFMDECDDVGQYQFAAMTFLLDDGTCYTAFRGTDDTVTGWREDFNLSYMAMTRGQELAAAYLDRMFAGTSQFIRVGGHSKGGNLAVYAGMYCLPEIRERIRDIYSNDGPGFNRKITESDDYRRIVPKIRKYLPEESIVGILLDSGTDPYIIKSSGSGLNQHSPYTWMIRRNMILRASKRTEVSKFIDRTLDDWINMLDSDSRRVFIDVLFGAIESSGAKKISEFTADPVKAYKAFYKALKDIPHEQRATLLLVLSKLAQSGKNQIVSGLTRYLSDLTNKA